MKKFLDGLLVTSDVKNPSVESVWLGDSSKSVFNFVLAATKPRFDIKTVKDLTCPSSGWVGATRGSCLG